MSRVFSIVFCAVVTFLVVYNVLVVFPSIRHDPSSRLALKYGTILVVVVTAKLIFKTRPQTVTTPNRFDDQSSYVDPDNARRFEV
jgi:hypothetical protein